MKNSILSKGWIPDLPDQRDYTYKITAVAPIPDIQDLSHLVPIVNDQDIIGSCTANAIASALDCNRVKQGKKPYYPSRLFIYYNERAMENTINSDSGAMIRDGIKSVIHEGAPTEKYWPYNINKFTKQPNKKAYTSALAHQALLYERIDTLDQMLHCLASGYPFVFGFSVYESFMSMTSAIMPLPNSTEKMLGGHAVLAVGYNKVTRLVKVLNSWGIDWGDNGYFYMPFDFISNKNHADDMWAIKQVE